MASVWSELKRRNVVRVAVAYAVVAWLLIEIADTIFPRLQLPDWTVTFVTVLLIMAFPVALVFAWAFELTPEGIKRERDVDREASITRKTGQKLNYLIIAVLGIAVLYLVADKLFWTEPVNAVALAVTDQSVAVLPFINLSADPEQEYFADGIAEELRSNLASLGELRVAGRRSSIAVKDQTEDCRTVGEALNVAYLLDGSVRKSGETVRINAELTETDDCYQVWSSTYERDLDDVFAIQDGIVRSVADALSITLGVGEGDLNRGGTRSIEAFEAYSTALTWDEIRPARVGRLYAVEHLEEAVSLDPNYAKAWSLLVFQYHFVANNNSNNLALRFEFTEKAKEAAQRVAEIAPDSVPALFAASFVQWRNLEWEAAEQSLLKALDRAPRHFLVNRYYAEFLINVGRPAEALPYLRQNRVTDPLNPELNSTLVWAEILAGDMDSAWRDSDELDNLDTPFYATKIAISLANGDLARASAIARSALEREGLGPAAGRIIPTILPLLDSPETARAELNRLYEELGPSVQFIPWAAVLGDFDLLLKIRRETFETTAGVWRSWEPILSEMRQLPGFKEYIAATGLVDYWRSTGNWGEYCRPLGAEDFECE